VLFNIRRLKMVGLGIFG